MTLPIFLTYRDIILLRTSIHSNYILSSRDRHHRMIALSGQFHLPLGCHIVSKLENPRAAACAFPAPAVAGCTLASPADGADVAESAAAAAATDIVFIRLNEVSKMPICGCSYLNMY